jgi:hypothetical protein
MFNSVSRNTFYPKIVSRKIGGGSRIAEMTTANLQGSPATGVDEKKWISGYLNMETQTGSAAFRHAQSRSIRQFQDLVGKGDWDLKSYSPDGH